MPAHRVIILEMEEAKLKTYLAEVKHECDSTLAAAGDLQLALQNFKRTTDMAAATVRSGKRA